MFSRKEAEAWYDNEEREERRKRARRAREAAHRMAAGRWGDLDEFTQIRRRGPDFLEFRSTSRFFMLAGAGFVLGAVFVVWWAAVLGVVLFFVGTGTVIDGTRRRVRSWRGWIYWPVSETKFGASEFDSVTITKVLGLKSVKKNVGRTLRYPLCLVDRNGRRRRLKACPYVEEARPLSEEINGLLGIRCVDESDGFGGTGPEDR